MATQTRTSARRIPKQGRSRATVDAIIEAAAHLLISRGDAEATTNDIAERAGVSIGSLCE
jgi:AcrR family transcriptional regulator